MIARSVAARSLGVVALALGGLVAAHQLALRRGRTVDPLARERLARRERIVPTAADIKVREP